MHALTWFDGVMIVGALVAAIIVGELVSRSVKWLLCKIIPHQGPVVTRVRGPIGLVAALGLWQATLAFLDLPEDARLALHDAGRVGLVLALVWLSLRVSDLAIDALARRKGVFDGHELGRSLLPIGRRVAKIVIIAVAIVAVLGSLGYSVTGLIAGLGIGGIAVALAAQKTLENVVGAFALGIDRPLKEGDVIRVDGTQGTVERVGLRSTRVRTQDRTMVAIPNGKLADSVIERLSGRDRFRFYAKFRLGISTTSRQLRQIREQIEQLLSAHAKRSEDLPQVHFVGTGETWFELEAMAWFDVTALVEFQPIRDDLFLGCLDIIADAGGSLNGPSNEVVLAPQVADLPAVNGVEQRRGIEREQRAGATVDPSEVGHVTAPEIDRRDVHHR